MVASARNPKAKPSRKSNAVWPLVRELAVQTLYLTDGLSPKQIAASISTPKDPVTVKAVSNLIQRRGWTAQLRANQRRSEELTLARTQEHVERVVQAQAAVAEAASVAGLQRALEATQDRSECAARDFRSWAGGARDLVNVMRQARGLDARAASEAGSGATVNIFAVGSLTFSAPGSQAGASVSNAQGQTVQTARERDLVNVTPASPTSPASPAGQQDASASANPPAMPAIALPPPHASA